MSSDDEMVDAMLANMGGGTGSLYKSRLDSWNREKLRLEKDLEKTEACLYSILTDLLVIYGDLCEGIPLTQEKFKLVLTQSLNSARKVDIAPEPS